MTKEDILSFYINHAIEDLRSQLKTTDVVDMVPLFGNALFELSCKLTVNRDLGAINPHGKIQPSVDILDLGYIFQSQPDVSQGLCHTF